VVRSEKFWHSCSVQRSQNSSYRMYVLPNIFDGSRMHGERAALCEGSPVSVTLSPAWRFGFSFDDDVAICTLRSV
jgi:hypothetical protein